MKSFLLYLLLIPSAAFASEIQLDHTFGIAPLATQALAFSPDEKRLAVAGSDGVKIYEATTGTLLENIAGAQTLTSCVAWSRDGKSLAIGGFAFGARTSGEILLWRPHEKVRRWTTDQAVIKSLDFSPDGRFLASASGGDLGGDRETGAIRVWSVQNQKLVRTLGTYYGYDARVSFGPKDRVALAYEGFDTSARRVFTWPQAKPLQTDDEGDSPLAWNQNGQLVSAHGPDALALQQRGDILRRVVLPARGETSKAVFIAQNTKSHEVLGRFELGQATLSATLGSSLLALSSPQGIRVWRVTPDSRKIFPLYTLNRTLAPDQLAVSGDGCTLGVATSRGLLLLDDNLTVKRLLPNVRAVQPIAFSRDGQQVWAGVWLDLTGVKTRVLTKSSQNEFESPGVGVLSPDGKILVLNGQLHLLDGKRVPLLVPDPSEDEPNATRILSRIFRVDWRTDGEKFVVTCASEGGSSSEDGFFVFDRSGHFERELHLEHPILHPRDAVFAPDGTTIFTLGLSTVYDPTERTNREWSEARADIWNASTGEHKATLPLSPMSKENERNNLVRFVRLSAQQDVMAVSGEFSEANTWGERLKFFDTKSAQQIASLPLQSFLYSRNLTWAFLDDKRVVSLNAGALEVWDWRAHTLLSRRYLVPDGAKIRLVVSPTSL